MNEDEILVKRFPNEHAARVKSPSAFQKDSFRRKNIALGIDIILGRLKGETTTTTQAYRFDKNKFTPTQAKKWLKDHKIKFMSFEEASEPPDKSADKCYEAIKECLTSCKNLL